MTRKATKMMPTANAADLAAPQASTLRQRAQTRFQEGSGERLDALTPQATRQLIHELRVYQIELEMQSDELRHANMAMEASRARYFELYDLAPVGYFTVSEKGLILEANLSTTKLFGVSRSALLKQPISGFIVKADQDIYYHVRRKLRSIGESRSCELRMLKHGAAEFWARLEATAAQSQDGEPVLLVVLSDVTERRLAQAALQDAQQRLLHVALRQQDEMDALHVELAHDVHDELGQTFAALKFEIDLIAAIAPTSAQRMYELVKQGVVSTRDISRALRPIALELGLVSALRAMTAELSTRSNVRITAVLPQTLPVLTGPLERALYRIAQEALTNAVLHAQAHAIEISLHIYLDRLELKVGDDGRGFALDSPSVHRGLGLLGMHERARQLGAELCVQSTPGKGCCVLVKLPTTAGTG